MGKIKGQTSKANIEIKSRALKNKKNPTDVLSFPLKYIYRNNDRLMDAELILSDWVDRNPSDKNAKKILEEIRSAG